jgi:hypothetical protein
VSDEVFVDEVSDEVIVDGLRSRSQRDRKRGAD